LSWQDHPDCPANGARLCRVEEIPDQSGWEVCFGSGKENFKILLLRQGQLVWSYLNFCPHFSLPLNYQPQTFVTLDGLIMCAHHTAFFNFDDGRCVDGPCVGDGLIPLPCFIQEGVVYFGAKSDPAAQ
jgi:nitrite reductase/ring-hydroxylating ferredoxin subunit